MGLGRIHGVSYSPILSKATNSFPIWLWLAWIVYRDCQQVNQTIKKKKERKRMSSRGRPLDSPSKLSFGLNSPA